MSAQPFYSDDLERRAEQQRERLQDSVSQLRSSVRYRLDPERAARNYVWQASATAGLLAFALGYAITGAFRD